MDDNGVTFNSISSQLTMSARVTLNFEGMGPMFAFITHEIWRAIALALFGMAWQQLLSSMLVIHARRKMTKRENREEIFFSPFFDSLKAIGT